MKQRKTKPTAQEIANIAGVSLTLVHRKLAQGKTPRAIIAEAEAHNQRTAQRRPIANAAVVNGHAATVCFAEAQRRKELALAALREHELATRTGEIVDAEQARAWIHHICTPLMQSIRALPDELRDLLPEGMEGLLRRRIEGIIASADRYVVSCFSRAGQPLGDGSLDCGNGYRVAWTIIPPPVAPPKKSEIV